MSGPLALTEAATVTTKCWPRDIRSVLGWKPLPSRTAKMTGAPETGAGKLLWPGDDGLAGVAVDDGMLAPAPRPRCAGLHRRRRTALR